MGARANTAAPVVPIGPSRRSPFTTSTLVPARRSARVRANAGSSSTAVAGNTRPQICLPSQREDLWWYIYGE
jgi:hypothetical protein